MRVLVTGACGFIGMHACEYLLRRGDQVLGIDNLNPYYDVELKKRRLKALQKYENFEYCFVDIANLAETQKAFLTFRPTRVLHLAAQAGVRYSISNPHVYTESNLVGFANVIEQCRELGIEHFVYASSSSVYGANTKLPYCESDRVEHPISLYAATKKSNELVAYTYSHLYRLPSTGLRFFTVYGPWGRPDMAIYKFALAISENQPIDVFNHGNMSRDFTYVDDIVEGTIRVLDKPATPTTKTTPSPSSEAPAMIFNIGNGAPVKLTEFIDELENAIGKPALRQLKPMQAGDVANTHADTTALQKWIGYQPKVRVKDGIREFVTWFNSYHER